MQHKKYYVALTSGGFLFIILGIRSIFKKQKHPMSNFERPQRYPRFKIPENTIEESDRKYLSYLAEAEEPFSIRLWSNFCHADEELLKGLVEKYKIPIIKGDIEKVMLLEIEVVENLETHRNISLDLLAKMKIFKKNLQNPEANE